MKTKTIKQFITLIVMILITITIPIKTNQIIAQQIVTDPTSYAYLIEQVARAQELIDKAQQQITKLDEVKDGISTMRTEIATIYNNTLGVVGQISDLKDQIEETPKILKEQSERIQSWFKCLTDDIDSYQKNETIFKAKYNLNTPEDHPFNFGTSRLDDDDNEDGKETQKYFGSDQLLQYRERPCGMVETYASEIKARQKTAELLTNEIENFLNEKTQDILKTKLDQIAEFSKKTNLKQSDHIAFSKDLLVDILLVLNDMKRIMILNANYVIANIGGVPDVPFDLTPQEQENLNLLTDREIYEPINIIEAMENFKNNNTIPIIYINIGSGE